MSNDAVLFLVQIIGGLAVLALLAVIADVVVPTVQGWQRRRKVRRLIQQINQQLDRRVAR